MIYSTLFVGPPYGAMGERGEDTENPEEYAKQKLRPDQRMLCFDANDPKFPNGELLRRFVCSQEFGTTETHV